MMMKSRAKAPGHLFKPDARLGVRLGLSHRLELGGSLTGLLWGSEHYRVLGLLAHGRFAFWQPGRTSLGVSGAFGAGYDADILHKDLRADGKVLPYGFVGLDVRVLLGAGFSVGAEVAFQNLSMLQLGAALTRQF